MLAQDTALFSKIIWLEWLREGVWRVWCAFWVILKHWPNNSCGLLSLCATLPYRSSSTWALKDSIRSKFSFIYLKDERLGEFVYISHGQYWISRTKNLNHNADWSWCSMVISWRISSLISIRLADKFISRSLWFRAELQFFRPRSRPSRSEKGQTGMRVTADIFKPITQNRTLGQKPILSQILLKKSWRCHFI